MAPDPSYQVEAVPCVPNRSLTAFSEATFVSNPGLPTDVTICDAFTCASLVTFPRPTSLADIVTSDESSCPATVLVFGVAYAFTVWLEGYFDGSSFKLSPVSRFETTW